MLAIVVGLGCVVSASANVPCDEHGAASMGIFTIWLVATGCIKVVPVAEGLELGGVALRVDVLCREAPRSLMRSAVASLKDVPPFLPYVRKVLPC